MSVSTLKKSLHTVTHEVIECRNKNNLVEHFSNYKKTFIGLMNLKDVDVETKKLVFIAYDRIVIDVLLGKELKFQSKDISLEEMIWQTASGGYAIISDAENATKANAQSYLILLLFVLNPDNTDITQDSIESLRKKLLDMTDFTPIILEQSTQDLFYRVETGMHVNLKALYNLIGLCLIIYLCAKLYILHKQIIEIIAEDL